MRTSTISAKNAFVNWVLASCLVSCLVAAAPFARAGKENPAIPRVSLREVHQAVLGELRSRAVPEEQLPLLDDIDLPFAVPLHAGSSLRISEVCWDRDADRARFRFACARAGDCLPFLVFVRSPSRAHAPSCQLGSRPGTPLAEAEIVLHAGERATAVSSTAGIRMSVAVTCLEPGSMGDIIRVRAREGRVFRARIVSRNLVQALFE